MPSSPPACAVPAPTENSAATAPAAPAAAHVPTAHRVRVAVTAPDPITHEGVLSQLRRHPEVELCKNSGPATVALFIEDTIDEAALTRLRRAVRSEGSRAVLVAGTVREHELLDVVECGVGAIVWRHEATAQRLVRAVLTAAKGGGDLPADLLAQLISQVRRLQNDSADQPGFLVSFTKREVDVVRLVADGFDNSEIALKLSYSERTVKNVMYGLTTRLHLRNRAHVVAYALREGFI
ncbi:helix-turn-helix transcriptional regulator [Streptomyces formicae]|uniref:Response regulator n=1 Tax=Streptomyces formicae TaxID=1616117 RepID=A0A291QMW6_9ACTN|nr:response regulator [Streptomyces formicae]